MEVTNLKKPEKILLAEINSYLTCYLCKGYLIDATTISECLHSFCRSCIIKFLKENSYCPVCEVVINKAKPDLKLDKTLQDIVYKLVPELFLKEMTRRKQFYKNYPEISAKVSPEERGEDTERTIFNPKDLISLSMEYISDDSSPGAIKIADSDQENEKLMKRYLQCPGMCRVEVLKKFVVNKYNVDTSLFYIDVLYKRVPLPDHYTLIDIAYIYSWKRNEPLKFYFRITDINKVSERFDYFKSNSTNNNNNEITAELKTTQLDYIPKTVPTAVAAEDTESVVKNVPNDNVESKQDVTVLTKLAKKLNNNNNNKKSTSQDEASNICDKSKNGACKIQTKSSPLAQSDTKKRKSIHKMKKLLKNLNSNEKLAENKLVNPSLEKRSENITQNDNKVYTNITLNRTNNVEIITKIEKVSGEDGQAISLNITKEIKKGAKQHINDLCNTMKPENTPNSAEPPDKDKKEINMKSNLTTSDSDKGTENKMNTNNPSVDDYEDEKSKFLKSIELTAKNVVQNIVSSQKKVQKKMAGQKRKNANPLKGEKTKKQKNDKKCVKVSSPSSPNTEKLDGLKTLINNCKINIPSSLSITLKENGDSVPSIIPPVKNYIEILKLPEDNVNPVNSNGEDKKSELLSPNSNAMDQDSEQKVDEDLAEIAKSLTEKVSSLPLTTPKLNSANKFPSPKHILTSSSAPPLLNDKVLSIKENLVKLSPRSPQTFQKIFEESIKKPDSPLTNKTDKQTKEPNCANVNTSTKRNILEIATQLVNKKTKLDQEETMNVNNSNKIMQTSPNSTPKVPIPRLPSQSQIKMQPKCVEDLKFEPVTANLHSSSLGMNYSVSVSANQNSLSPTLKANGVVSPVKTDKVALIPSEDVRTEKSESVSKQLELKLDVSESSPKNNPMKQSSPKSISPKPCATTKPGTSPVSSSVSQKESSPAENSSNKVSTSSVTTTSNPVSPKLSTPVAKKSPVSPLSSNQLLEKYNIQNLAQLTASLNFNTANFGLNPTNQLAALQHAMILKHIEMQNRQNWLNLNQGPLMQYEKYLQSLNGSQNHLLSNIKEN